jgi:hypothetical protein
MFIWACPPLQVLGSWMHVFSHKHCPIVSRCPALRNCTRACMVRSSRCISCRVMTTSSTAIQTGRRRRVQIGCGNGALFFGTQAANLSSSGNPSLQCACPSIPGILLSDVLAMLCYCGSKYTRDAMLLSHANQRCPYCHALRPAGIMRCCGRLKNGGRSHMCQTCSTPSLRAARTTEPACLQQTCRTSKVCDVLRTGLH